MRDKHKYETGQLFNFARDSYLERTSRPVYALVFLLPFIVFYELGTVLINTDVLNQSQIRVVTFVWLQNLLEYIGFGSKATWAAPPLMVIVILAALQMASRKQWHFKLADFVPMAVECILLAVPLIVLSLFLNSPPQQRLDIAPFESADSQTHTDLVSGCSSVLSCELSVNAENAGCTRTNSESLMANIVTAIGAGIYEELVFRLVLICLLMIFFEDVLKFSHKRSIVVSVLVSAALFSAHHHIILLGGHFAISMPFSWAEFSFRTIAGIYFAVVFSLRGFGITAGTHGFYDIIATTINATFFLQ